MIFHAKDQQSPTSVWYTDISIQNEVCSQEWRKSFSLEGKIPFRESVNPESWEKEQRRRLTEYHPGTKGNADA